MRGAELDCIQKATFFGFNVSVFNRDQLHCFIERALVAERPLVSYGYSLGMMTRLKRNPELYSYINSFDLLVTDGRLFYLVCKLFGLPLDYDISIPYLTELVLDIGDKNKSSVMIIGSTKKNNILATNNLKTKYPNMVVYEGYDGGDFSDHEYDGIVEHVNRYEPDILLIGVSSPKKERFAFKKKADLHVKIIIPCGGMIDILSGKARRIPYAIKKAGFGWAWRIMQEPNRFFVDKIQQVFEILFGIMPAVFYHIYIRNDQPFFLPSIYGIKRIEHTNRHSFSQIDK
jgi:N-acetylglucosaminyldiphosphoundecaprenol N-acetyl-beta-D-mannosaminyltransferase